MTDLSDAALDGLERELREFHQNQAANVIAQLRREVATLKAALGAARSPEIVEVLGKLAGYEVERDAALARAEAAERSRLDWCNIAMRAEAQRNAAVKALREMTEVEHSNARRMRRAIVEARERLAKGRALWNGPCHECDAVLEQALRADNGPEALDRALSEATK